MNKVIKVIKNSQDEVTHSGSFDSEAQAQAWIVNQQSLTRPWDYTDDSEYTIEDVSPSQIELDDSQAIESRLMEYPSVQEMLHILADHGLESQEWADLQTARQAVKTKYPKS